MCLCAPLRNSCRFFSHPTSTKVVCGAPVAAITCSHHLRCCQRLMFIIINFHYKFYIKFILKIIILSSKEGLWTPCCDRSYSMVLARWRSSDTKGAKTHTHAGILSCVPLKRSSQRACVCFEGREQIDSCVGLHERGERRTEERR